MGPAAIFLPPRTDVALTPRKVTITAAVQNTDAVVFLSQLSK
jgi:hypothetical protein